MARTEHFHDPGAPTANRIVVAAVAFVQDDAGRLLLIQRSDNGLWAMPGGVMEVGEHVAQTAERETLEETGYVVKVVGLVGTYSDPGHVITYDDGEVRQQFALCFRAELVGGELRTSPESPTVRWVAQDDLADVPIHQSTLLRIRHGLAGEVAPYLG